MSNNLETILKEKILFFDGAMGTMLQRHKFEENDFRGERFKDWPCPIKGNNDVLSLTQPEAVENIHKQYIDAGANIISTNTFSSTSIAQADYEMQSLAYELNKKSAELVKAAIARKLQEDASAIAFCAGAIGPTNRTLSISPDVNNPGFRAIDFDTLKNSYKEAVQGLLDGGADILLVETIFDTLNAKAAIVAIKEELRERNVAVPIIISGTITDKSGRTLTGQTPTAFWYSVMHAKPLAIGFNCALGAKDLLPHLREISKAVGSDALISVYPNAGLPNAFGGYDQTPDEMAKEVEIYAKEGLINIIGGCCGTTPEHIKAIHDTISKYEPRKK